MWATSVGLSPCRSRSTARRRRRSSSSGVPIGLLIPHYTQVQARRRIWSAAVNSRFLREFLSSLGHELRTPLAAIRNALHLLEQQGDDAVTRDSVRSMMERQTQSIGRLIEDMLEVSHIEHGTIALRRQS